MNLTAAEKIETLPRKLCAKAKADTLHAFARSRLESRMQEICKSGSMSGERKRDDGQWPQVTAPLLDSTNAPSPQR